MKKLIFAFLILFLSHFNGYSQNLDSLSKAQDYNSYGYELMMDGKIKEAIPQFDKAISYDPDNDNYFHNRAYCYFELDSIAFSTSDYLKAIELNPWNYEYYYLIGNNYQRIGKFSTAIKNYSKALSITESKNNQDTYLILFNRGNCYLKTKRLLNALTDYNLSLELNPYHPPTNANRGTAKFRQNDTIGACYDWFIAISNNVTEVRKYYHIYCSECNFEDSLMLISNTNELNQQEINSLQLIPDTLENQVAILPEFPGGEYERVKYLNENIKYPQRARQRGIQGKVLISFLVEFDGTLSNIKVIESIGGGCDEEAIRLVENMPNWTPGLQNGNPVSVKMNMPIQFKSIVLNNFEFTYPVNHSETIDLIDQLMYPGVDINYDRGVKNMEQGYYQTASKWFSKSIKREGYGMKQSYANRAVCSYKLGNYEAAFQDIEVAKEFNWEIINKIISSLYLNLGNDAIETNETEKAMTYYTEGFMVNSRDTEVLIQRGKLYLLQNDSINACNDFTTAYHLHSEEAKALLKENCNN